MLTTVYADYSISHDHTSRPPMACTSVMNSVTTL